MRFRALVLGLAVSATALHGQNSVSVVGSAALGPPSSHQGLRVTLVDQVPRTQTWVMVGPSQGFNDETSLRGSFFIDPQGMTMSTLPGLGSFQMMDFFDTVQADSHAMLIFHLVYSQPNWHINVWHFNQNLNGGAGSYQFSAGGFFAVGGNPNWHNNRIDFAWTAGNPGHLALWRTRYLNGAPDASGTIQIFSVPLAGMQSAKVNYVFAGMFASQDPGTFGTLLLDEFSFGR